MDLNKILELKALAGERGEAPATKPLWEDIRALIHEAEEAHRLRAVLAEVGRRNRESMKLVAHATQELNGVLRTAHVVDEADAYISERVLSLMDEGKLVNAIKELRDANPGLGLADAKRICDRLRDRPKGEPGAPA